jgi:two-component system, LytTR family, response regulator
MAGKRGRVGWLIQPHILPPGGGALWLGGTILLWLLYAFVFVQTTDSSLVLSLLDAGANVLPLSLLALMTHALLKDHVMPRGVRVQMLMHGLLAVAFATLWYAAVLILLAFLGGLRGGSYTIRGFSSPAFTWQVFQGLILYALIAATCYAIRGGRQAANLTIIDAPRAPPPLERYLTKTGDEMSPVLVSNIITITGAQDYSEVVSQSSTHLVRLSLSEFEERLDPQRFLRVHRSTIINFDHLARAEPAGGGRMVAHMNNGAIVQVSRAGTQVLRRFIV